MKVGFVAAPLVARSGVYRSARELVMSGRRAGHDWSLMLGVSGRAAGAIPQDDPAWIFEFESEPHGLRGIRQLRKRINGHELFAGADVLISLNPQADMALATTRRRWIAYLRAQPWPNAAEVGLLRSLAWRTLEEASLRRARATWVTTDVLASQVRSLRGVLVVPPGLSPRPRTWDGCGLRRLVVWAARFDADKNPQLFPQILAAEQLSGLRGAMFGVGPLETKVRESVPANVSVLGWSRPEALWSDALAYVGTSHREAFGRSAVEAAMAGIPVVLSDTFGCAPMLYTDPDLRRQFVLPRSSVQLWVSAIQSLANDQALRMHVSDHIAANAAALSVESSVCRLDAQLREECS